MARWAQLDCPMPGKVRTDSTLCLRWLAGAEHRKRTLARTWSSNVWSHGRKCGDHVGKRMDSRYEGVTSHSPLHHT